jgi:hypothetical protein
MLRGQKQAFDAPVNVLSGAAQVINTLVRYTPLDGHVVQPMLRAKRTYYYDLGG